MIKHIIILAVVIPFLFSCGNKKGSKYNDSPTSGDITIAVDETLAPIIRQEIDVFQSIYISANITDLQVSEIEAFNLLLNDSVRMIVAARTL